MASDLVSTVSQRIQELKGEYYDLKHKRAGIDVALEKTKAYIDKLNVLLVSEGQQPIRIDVSLTGSIVRKPGNRAKDYPVRRVEWEGMPIRIIIGKILGEAHKPLHADDIGRRIYEVQADTDLKRVKPSLVSQLHRGSKMGHWEAVGRNTYKAKDSMLDLPELVPAMS